MNHTSSPLDRKKWRDKVLNFGASRFTQSMREGTTNRKRLEIALDVRTEKVSVSRPHQPVKNVIRQSHSLVACPPFLSRRSSLASPLLCRVLKKTLSSHLISAISPKNSPSMHVRAHWVGTASPCSTTTHQETRLFERNEHVSGRRSGNEAVRFRHRTSLRFKHSPTFRHHNVRFEPLLPAGCACVCARVCHGLRGCFVRVAMCLTSCVTFASQSL